MFSTSIFPRAVLAGAAFAGAAFAFAAPASAQLGPDAAACRRGNASAVLVTVDGFRQRTGNIRVAIYGSDPRRFLARGQTLRKINVPVTRAGPMRICVALPNAGRYAVAVRHDVNGNNQSRDWSDGAGFSRNPRISMTNLRPNYNNVAISVGRGVMPLSVVLNYRFGLAIRPVRAG
ncbi:MAG TPA: DUF2141 domain-containing protein [Allosphingosinicella sp.]|nr:DUF2141 domain-containing protein [Allosphingosinicella sp.]